MREYQLDNGKHLVTVEPNFQGKDVYTICEWSDSLEDWKPRLELWEFEAIALGTILERALRDNIKGAIGE